MQPHTRRGVLLAAAATLTTTAGCLGGDSNSREDGQQTTTTGEASSTTEPETTEEATTQTNPASVCSPWDGAVTPFDVTGTPFIFGYDYVETWTPGEISDAQGYLQRLTSPTVGENDATMTTRISLTPSPLTAAERDEEIEYRKNLDSEPRVVVDEITYAGETLRVLGLREEDIALYPPGYSVFLPHGSGDDRRYYPMGVTTFGSLRVADEELDTCIAVIDAAQWTILRSLRPNPETTFDEA